MPQLEQIDALYAQARALEAAAEMATMLAVRAGASTAELEATLGQAVQGSAPSPSKHPLLEAQQHLAGRRAVCLAVTRLALRHGVDPHELLRQLNQAGQQSSQLHLARVLSDLGFEPAQ